MTASMNEIWKPIVGYEDTYYVSNTGKIKNIKTNKLLTPQNNANTKYKCIILTKKCKQKRYRVHYLVAKAFVYNPNPDVYTQINHKDENPANNNYTNLEWCTSKYNCNYGSHIEKLIKSNGTKVKVINTITDETIIFNSIRECARNFNTINTVINKYANTHSIYRGKYKFIILWDYV